MTLIPQGHRYDEAVTAIYTDAYSAKYADVYTAPWQAKHRLNATNLESLFAILPPQPFWLDLACGQAWHFARFPDRARKLGLDISYPQLNHAKKNAPDASFVCADMLHAPLPTGTFDLVTNFWAGYCYLAAEERIVCLLKNMIRWLRPGGALYIEVLLAHDLERFNHSVFANNTGFRVVPLSENYEKWSYQDSGGEHRMFSPSLQVITSTVFPHFEKLITTHDGAFITHLIATLRR